MNIYVVGKGSYPTLQAAMNEAIQKGGASTILLLPTREHVLPTPFTIPDTTEITLAGSASLGRAGNA